jgi:hypothetical protein
MDGSGALLGVDPVLRALLGLSSRISTTSLSASVASTVLGVWGFFLLDGEGVLPLVVAADDISLSLTPFVFNRFLQKQEEFILFNNRNGGLMVQIVYLSFAFSA